MRQWSPVRVTSCGLGLSFLSACVGTPPHATSPAPAPSSAAAAVADTSGPSAAPIYILDGDVIPTSAVAAIDPKNIASVTILKGLEAVSAYGERARNGVIVITLVPPDARAQPCRPPTPTTEDVASIIVADLVQTEPYTESIRVDRHRSTWPMVRLVLRVRHGWKRNPLLSEGWHKGDTLFFSVTPEQDPKLPAGVRVLAYLQPSFTQVATRAGDTTITTVEDSGFLHLFPCHSVQRLEDAQSDLRLLGQPEWQVP